MGWAGTRERVGGVGWYTREGVGGEGWWWVGGEGGGCYKPQGKGWVAWMTAVARDRVGDGGWAATRDRRTSRSHALFLSPFLHSKQRLHGHFHEGPPLQQVQVLCQVS